jgi:hypothetical protein
MKVFYLEQVGNQKEFIVAPAALTTPTPPLPEGANQEP